MPETGLNVINQTLCRVDCLNSLGHDRVMHLLLCTSPNGKLVNILAPK
jgi:hypothetical protein